jgi:hypothetical protein
MNRLLRLSLSTTFAFSLLLFAFVDARAQCDEVVSGLDNPLSITQSNIGNLIVSETGDGTLHSGRISIVSTSGERRTLLDGLPSAINDVAEPSGPAGVFMHGRTLYLAMGVGDAILAGPIPGTAVANPTPSSPLFSSVLALHFSAGTESSTDDFTLTPAHEATLASGGTVVLSEGGQKLTIKLVANFPNFTPNVFPTLTVTGSNPFDLVAVGNFLYVTDGGQNTVRKVNTSNGAFSTLVTFPDFDNPTSIGPPTIDAVPTGIAYFNGRLLVTLFTGFPFPARVSEVVEVNTVTGAFNTLIGRGRLGGLKTAIDVIQTAKGHTLKHVPNYFVLQHASGSGPFLTQPGVLLRFGFPGLPGFPVATCFERPTSMVLDAKTKIMYVTELGPLGPPAGPGRVVAVPLP